jgi:glycosyltransferase A (GT-A) superfamily protein (DUF2064 family)
MSSETLRKSLMEQILEATFEKLVKLEIFKTQNVQQLRDLARSDDLSRYNRIIEALKFDLGDADETS